MGIQTYEYRFRHALEIRHLSGFICTRLQAYLLGFGNIRSSAQMCPGVDINTVHTPATAHTSSSLFYLIKVQDPLPSLRYICLDHNGLGLEKKKKNAWPQAYLPWFIYWNPNWHIHLGSDPSARAKTNLLGFSYLPGLSTFIKKLGHICLELDAPKVSHLSGFR